jgi:hypothetical protein
MFPNPYVAQQMAEMKIADAHREADKQRLLASLPKAKTGDRSPWALALVAASAVTLILIAIV